MRVPSELQNLLPHHTLRNKGRGSVLRLLLALSATLSSACLEVPEKSISETDQAGGMGTDASVQVDAGPGNGDTDAGGTATGSIELAGTNWLTAMPVTVRFKRVSQYGAPFLAVYSDQAASALTSFRIPFVEGEQMASGSHTFDPLPVGAYAVRLIYNNDNVLEELPFNVRADSDGDRTADEEDGCALDPSKTSEGICGCGVADLDVNADGAADCIDECDQDPAKTGPGVCGCGIADSDGDSDGTMDCQDACSSDPNKVAPGVCGCAVSEADSDNDGTLNCQDQCPSDPNKVARGLCGCGVAEGSCVPSDCSNEMLPNTKLLVGEKRCSLNGQFTFILGEDGYVTLREGSEVLWAAFQSAPAISLNLQDSDGNLVARKAAVPGSSSAVWASGVTSSPGAILTVEDNGSVVVRHMGIVVWSVGPFGSGDTYCREARENQMARLACPAGQTISGFDFASYGKPTGVCGSYAVDSACHYDAKGFVQTECIGDNACEFLVDKAKFTTPCTGTKRLLVAYSCVDDACPADPTKVAPGVCGCGMPEDATDGDSDGTPDCADECPGDANKIAEGACGCGVAEVDGDLDGTPDCIDACPADPNKIAQGTCGCGVAESATDGDGDGVVDCVDGCPGDANKTAPGTCGCGTPDSATDGDGDGVVDCIDECPGDANKAEAGVCGCGIDESDCPPACSSEMLPNSKLLVGEKRCSPNGRYKFILGTDGFLTFREGNTVLWAAHQVQGSPAVITAAATVTLQKSDGNLVARPAGTGSVWASGVTGKPDAVLTVEDNGSVVVRQLGVVVWSIGPFQSGETYCREARENQMARLECPTGKTLSTVEFASYGKPTGVCGSYASEPTCHFAAQSFVETECTGDNTCEFLVDKIKFTTPCSGTKRLVVAYTCGSP